MRPPSAEQVRAFLDGLAGDRFEALYTAAIGLGIRQGELLALRWSDVDLDAGAVTIRHTLERGSHRLAEPKTERARRTLRMPAGVTDALREHRRRQLANAIVHGPGAFVFASSRGTPLDSRNVTRAFQAALERAGLPRQRFHDMRHACATLLLEGGDELGVVSRIIGHANLATTADVYAHLTPAMEQRAADRMDGILGRRVS